MFIAMLFLTMGVAMAQTTASGVVVSAEDDQPIVGATVRVVGSKTGTVTDMNGAYSIKLASNSSKLELLCLQSQNQPSVIKRAEILNFLSKTN